MTVGRLIVDNQHPKSVMFEDAGNEQREILHLVECWENDDRGGWSGEGGSGHEARGIDAR